MSSLVNCRNTSQELQEKEHYDEDSDAATEAAHQSNCFGGRKISLAKIRWKMLSKSVLGGASSNNQPIIGSTRQFTSFGLIKLINGAHQCGSNTDRAQNAVTDLANGQHVNGTSKENVNNNHTKDKSNKSSTSKGNWYRCLCDEEPNLELEIRLLTEKLPLKDLVRDSDNTGNVCVWPSEEILAYYCLKNKELCSDKLVVELGGGMTCLSGFVVATACAARKVICTDGNDRSLLNINQIKERNSIRFGATSVNCRRLRWGHDIDCADLFGQVDVVLSADCLYFDEGRKPLVNTIWNILNDTGVAVILAPRRGMTFEHFVALCTTKGFQVEQVLVYDTHVYELHERFIKELANVYSPELHYPRMIVLKKPS